MKKTLKVGQKATMKKVITLEDVAEYIDITEDRNPIYIDESYCCQTVFQRPIVPPDLVAMMLSNLLGTKLPGRGANWLKAKLRFPNPAYLGEEITGVVEITRIRPDKQLVNLRGVFCKADGKVVCEAETLMLVKDLVE